MAGEIQYSFKTALTSYFLIRDRNGNIWNTSSLAFEAYSTPNYATKYGNSATEQGTASALYFGTFPATVVPGTYNIVAKQQVGGSPAETDPTVAVGNYEWNGTATTPLSDTATSGQIGQVAPIRAARGVMLQNFGFKLVSSTDHVTNFTSGIVSGQISRDGGNFGVLQLVFVETGLGWYNLSALTSGDLLANTVKLVFTANGISGGSADQRDFFMITQRTSGQ